MQWDNKMKDIDFLIKDETCKIISITFPNQTPPIIPENMRGMRDADIVYDYFSGKDCNSLITNLSLKDDSYALELGVVFLPEDIFLKYLPLYITASLHNKDEFWVFESDFIQQYLCPDYRGADVFLDFVINLSDLQTSFIAQFMAYKSVELELPFINKACEDFWSFYL